MTSPIPTPQVTTRPDWTDAVTTAADALQRVYDALENGLIENPRVPVENWRHRVILTHADAMAIRAAHSMLSGTTPDAGSGNEVDYKTEVECDHESIRYDIEIGGESYSRTVQIVPTEHDDARYEIDFTRDRKPHDAARLEVFDNLVPAPESLFEDWLDALHGGGF